MTLLEQHQELEKKILRRYNRCAARLPDGRQCFCEQSKGLYDDDHWKDQAGYRPFRDSFGFTEDHIPPHVMIPDPRDVTQNLRFAMFKAIYGVGVNLPDELLYGVFMDAERATDAIYDMNLRLLRRQVDAAVEVAKNYAESV